MFKRKTRKFAEGRFFRYDIYATRREGERIAKIQRDEGFLTRIIKLRSSINKKDYIFELYLKKKGR